ncbi:MAG: IS1380 family transposase [Thermoanaerobaculia bacterium]|nr:IS1380 family transposase [Thermoanaerobaculia bacterium]
MSTDCTSQPLHLQAAGRRFLTAAFDGGQISSDAGALLLRVADNETALTERLAACFVDLRDPARVEHSVLDLIRQRLFGLALGYEDLNDHDDLRCDPLLAEVVGKREPTGADRVRAADRGQPLAGKSTLNRLEWSLGSEAETDRYHRIALDPEAMNTFFVALFLDSFEEVPEEIILDFDATDDPLHGQQEGRFFHGYYDCYCYLPLYVFCGHHLLWAQLRTSDRDASDGSVDVLEILVPRIRERWPDVQILLRSDSGFARDAILSWCEQNDVGYVTGLARNQRLERLLKPTLERAEKLRSEEAPKIRLFEDLEYETLNTWSRSRRVVGKAEVSSYGRNPRFVVTS